MAFAPNLISATTLLSAYTTITAYAILAKTIIGEVQSLASQIVPQFIRQKFLSKFKYLTGAPQTTLIIDEYNDDGFTQNDVFTAADLFLRTKLAASVSIARVNIQKKSDDDEIILSPFKEETLEDFFQGIQVVWKLGEVEKKKGSNGVIYSDKTVQRSLELTFFREFNDQILSSYIPYLLEFAKTEKQEKKTVMLHSIGRSGRSIKLNHPSTFETMAMDPVMKKDLIDDLDRFVQRKGFYRRVGKAWKRGYLLYGPPGTGKSSLIAAMANYLKFDIYDLELTSLRSNSDFTDLLLKTQNRSIIVVEDIDCSREFHTRQFHTKQSVGHDDNANKQVTLSGLLNFMDGLWSSCGQERIIVFTTNDKDRLDPALLRPGRMDKHIHMSYCSPSSFRILCSNYLGITDHPKLPQIDDLLMTVEASPAEIAEELMRNHEAEIALEALIALLMRKRNEKEVIDEGRKDDSNCKTGKDEHDDDESDFFPDRSVYHVSMNETRLYI